MILEMLNHHNRVWNTIPILMAPSQRKLPQHQMMMCSLLFSTHHCLQQRTPLCFPKPYLYNWDFKDSDQALRYITRYFNHKTIHQSLQSFPNLTKDFIYLNTYVETHCFNQLQHYINKSILDQNAAQLELHMRYSTSTINPYIIQCVL